MRGAALSQVLGVEEQRRRDQEIGRRAVAGDGHVVEHGQPQQRLHVDVVRLGGQRVPEEDDEVQLRVHQHSADLRVAAQRPGA